MDPLTDAETVVGYWRPLTDAELPVAENLISVASALIRRRFTQIDTWLVDGTLDRTIVEYVITEMIKSAVDATSRPVDAKSIQEGIGPYNEAVTYAAAARLEVTDDLAGLIEPVGETRPTLRSIRLKPGLAPYRCDFGRGW